MLELLSLGLEGFVLAAENGTGLPAMDDVIPAWMAFLLPVLMLVGTALLLFVADTINPDDSNITTVAGISIAGTLGALVVAIWYLLADVGQNTPDDLIWADQLVVDTTSLFFTVIVTSVTALVLIGSIAYFEDSEYASEFYSLVLLAATGMVVMAHASSLVTVFIALELASLPSYALVAFLKQNRGSVEAGLKYFLIGALSSAIFLYGITLIYGATGTMQLSEIGEAFESGAVSENGMTGIAGIGVIMLIGGFAFKTASVPFHFWAPEAYEGAPAPVSALLSSASKAAGFVIAFRVFVEAFPIGVLQDMGIDWVLIFGVLAVVTMLLGNLAAAVQTNVKRMLAYSSIGHAGYVLIALAALTNPGETNSFVLSAGMIHLLVYGFMNTGAFLFIALSEHWNVGRTFEDFNGLWREAPIACVAMAVLLVNLAGLPLGGGFFSKYVLFSAAVDSGFWWLAAVGAGASALSLFYYARLLKAMFIEEPPERTRVTDTPLSLYIAVIGAAIVTIVLLAGFGLITEQATTAADQLFA